MAIASRVAADVPRRFPPVVRGPLALGHGLTVEAATSRLIRSTMVNFRFHLVSLIAVFLALGLGILIGSTVVNQATVQTIRREIRDVRAEVNSLRSANGQLKDDLNRSNAFLADSRRLCRRGSAHSRYRSRCSPSAASAAGR